MDYPTARQFLIDQGTALLSQRNPDAFLMLLKRQQQPIPGQMTSILLALKVVFEELQRQEYPDYIDRHLAYAIYLLAIESQQLFARGQQAGVQWTPLLKEDIHRIDLAARSIFAGIWQEEA